jgi:protein SCO1/2
MTGRCWRQAGRLLLVTATVALIASWASSVVAAPGAAFSPPPAVAAVDIEEKLGGHVPLDLSFTDATGRRVRLGDLFDGQHPVALVLAYYRCPMLCDLVLAGVSRAFRQLGWTPGREYRAVTGSIDPKDRPGAAHLKQTAVLQAVNQTGAAAEAGWPFLVGDAASIGALADSVGFRYAYDPTSNQYAHPAVAVVLTPQGRISRYLYGVDFRVLDVRLGMTEAAEARVVGSIVNRLLLTCFHYDPSTRRYGFYVSAVLKGGASLVILAVGAFLAVLWRRDARRRSSPGREDPRW